MALEKEDIMALISILQKGLQDSDDDKKSTPKKTRKTRSENKSKTTKEPIVNKFLTMPERNMHKEDTLIDKKLRVAPLTERTRKFKPVTVRCRVCGKQEEVNPSYVESIERYKCNRCSTSAG